jgi:single-strand DNA-binding protein
MSEGLNRVELMGNLGADPELRATPGGQSVCKLRIATTRTYLDRQNIRQESTEWHRVVVWGPRGEALARMLSKGDRIRLDGELRTSTYEKNGEKRYSTDIHAFRVDFCSPLKKTHGARTTGDAAGELPPAQSPPGEVGGAAPPDDELPF